MKKTLTTAKQFAKTKQDIINNALHLRQNNYFVLQTYTVWYATESYVVGDYLAWLWFAATGNKWYYPAFAKRYLSQWFDSAELAECNVYDAIKNNERFEPVEPNNLWKQLNTK